MNKIVLYDGTEIEGGLAVKSAGTNQLYVTVPGSNLTQYAIMFGNPEKTQKIICYTGVFKFTYNGYTRLTSIGINTENNVELYLTGDNLSDTTEYTVPEIYLPEEMRFNNSEEVNSNE